MKKALLMAPMGSVHRRFNKANIKALSELGYEVHLLANFEIGEGTEKQNQEYADECREKGIYTHSIPYQRHSLLKNLRLIKETKALLKKENFDLIHAHTETGGLILRLSLSVAKNAKLLYTPHGMSFYKGSSIKSQIIYRPVESWICKKMDSNLAINQEEYETILAWKKDSAKLTHGIGLDVKNIQRPIKTKEEVLNEFGIAKNLTVILSIGELDDNKNHETVLKALSKLDRRNFAYVICGIGEKDGYLLKLAEQLEISDRFVLAGYRRDIPDIINAADIFVFPSKHEGLPVSLMEAMAGGLPIICSDIRGNRDIIRDGENGMLFNPNNVNELTNKLSDLLNDRQKQLDFAKKVKKEVIFYSQEKVVEELKDIYGKQS